MTQPNLTDAIAASVLVIVPKDDEFVETRRAFAVLDSSVEVLTDGGEVEYFLCEVGAATVAVACMDTQGNDESQTITTNLISRFGPTFVCLTGTALGNPSYASVGAVFASRQVLGLTQIRHTPTGPVYQNVLPVDAHKSVLRDLRDHLDNGSAITLIREAIGERAEQLNVEVDTGRYTFDSEIMGSGNEYFRTTQEQIDAQLWTHYPNARAYDMESWGVIQAAESAGLDWLVVRGVSDFGVENSMSSAHRQLAAFASARMLRSFLESPRPRTTNGQRAHRVERDELPRNNFYAKTSKSVATFQERIGRDLEIELGADVLDRALTPTDLIEVLVKAGAVREEAEVLLPVVHEEYFRDKYLTYRYRDALGHAVDSRALTRDWAKSIRDAFSEFGLNALLGKSAINVGCGNGAELASLFPDAIEASEIILVDLARELLDLARAELPTGKVRTAQCSAANLADVVDDSMDLYVSLRAYQSRMFDIEGAFREAYRVTRAGGVIGVSISNGYSAEVLDRTGLTHEVIIPGLKASGMDRSVSQSAPYDLAARLRKLFSKFDMSARVFDLPHGEILVCGRVGNSYAADYVGA